MSEKKKVIAIFFSIFFVVVGIFLMIFGFPLISHPGSSVDPYYGSYLLAGGVVITILAVIGGIVVLIPRHRIISRSSVFFLFGIILIIVGYFLSFVDLVLGIIILPIGVLIAGILMTIFALVGGIKGLYLSHSRCKD